MATLSIGIMVYNEEANIEVLLRTISSQTFSHGKLLEIIVVASGCTDRTEYIVQEHVKQDKRVRLIYQPLREGKASAINLFLSVATGDILILESGDTIPDDNALDKLMAPFSDPAVGMTGAHPIPINSPDTFIGFTVNLMWRLHHKIALLSPKLGELVAFRNVVREIPAKTAVDEASIESIVRNHGYRLCYVPDAIVRNKGPQNIRDFIMQRRRISAGHTALSKQEKYKVSTSSPYTIIKILLSDHSWSFRDTVWTLGAIGLELFSRTLGYYDFCFKKKVPYIWDIAYSTKRLD
jgi:cellulose synthase/poly-beta-1,6-N-acetylglucosamine synthase-like glycosyltransferase